ncbi:hypothetical protein F2Q68_00003328 [Brassica cretica]|uniref:Uncharacterized protein n=1 Tax=Brassica cretica TaxID=69181 RepID=A0A8S9JNH7_BRACR|nr:hypothetical protein F2Q68_00003328 [Brassica cretica]
MVKRVDGIVPTKKFKLASKYSKLDSELMFGGSVPVNSCLRLPMESGMLPERDVSERSRYTRELLPLSSGR